jgi:hypothetical protein
VDTVADNRVDLVKGYFKRDADVNFSSFFTNTPMACSLAGPRGIPASSSWPALSVADAGSMYYDDVVDR